MQIESKLIRHLRDFLANNNNNNFYLLILKYKLG